MWCNFMPSATQYGDAYGKHYLEVFLKCLPTKIYYFTATIFPSKNNSQNDYIL